MFYADLIPNEFKQHQNFVAYRKGSNDDKKPIIIKDLPRENPAKADDVETWGSWADGYKWLDSDRIGGLGFELGLINSRSGIVCIDIDHCVDEHRQIVDAVEYDKKTGYEIYRLPASEIVNILERFNTYTEISPSGTGLHIFCKGQKDFNLCDRHCIEVYDFGRYIRLTGNLFCTDYSEEIEERQEQIDWLGKKHFDLGEPYTPNSITEAELVKNADEIKEALNYIKCSKLTYNLWLYVGTVLKKAGCECCAWDEWSKTDPPRYKSDDCVKRWNNLGKSENFKLNLNAYIMLAKDNGFEFKFLKATSNQLPKKWKREQYSDNDKELFKTYKDVIDSFDISKNLIELKNDEFWVDVLNNASKNVLDQLLIYINDVVSSHKKKNWASWFDNFSKNFLKSKDADYINSLTEEQRKIYDEFIKEKKKKAFPFLDDNGYPIVKSEDNIKHLLKLLSFEVKENVVTRTIEVYHNGHYINEYSNKLDTFLVKLMTEGKAVNYDASKNMIADLLRLATIKYNPFIEYIENCYAAHNNECGYMKALFECFVLGDAVKDDSDILFKWFEKWLVQVVVLAYNNGSKNDVTPQTMLVLTGKQGQGKSTFIEKLLPAGMVLREQRLNVRDKDDVNRVTSAVITELSEFGRTAKDVDNIKSFLTTKIDVLRLPYDAKVSRFPRTTSFYGTVNELKFLTDDTGNRRFIVLPVIDIKRNKLNSLDKEKLWAEVYYHARVLKDIDISVSLDEAKKINQYNELYRQLSEEEIALLDTFDLNKVGERSYTVSEISYYIYGVVKNVTPISRILARWREEKKIKFSQHAHQFKYYLSFRPKDFV